MAVWTGVFLANESAAQLSLRVRLLVADMRMKWAKLDRRIVVFDDEFAASERADVAARRLVPVSGIRPIDATTVVAAVGDAGAFRRARDLAAWLGLVPKQGTTGNKPKLLRIMTRGSRYLRKNVIHGASAVLPRLPAIYTRLCRWLGDLLARPNKNPVIVALAAKLGRIAWAVLARGPSYEAALAG